MQGSIRFDDEHNLEINFSENEKNITNLADGQVYPVGGGGGGDDVCKITCVGDISASIDVLTDLNDWDSQVGGVNIGCYNPDDQVIGYIPKNPDGVYYVMYKDETERIVTGDVEEILVAETDVCYKFNGDAVVTAPGNNE